METAKEIENAKLEKMAAINDMYAVAAEKTYEETGRISALHSARLHRACAAEKRAKIQK